jgi:hypothetical protein
MTDRTGPLRVAITGATGMVGTALTRHVREGGSTVIPISRQAIPDGIRWDPARGVLDAAGLETLDAVFNLAGENLTARRWSTATRQRLRDSRIRSTMLLATTLARIGFRGVLVSVSAVGIYGNAGDRELDETSPLGGDFLATLCRDWEAAADPARAAGIRVVHPRLGVVLSSAGGLLGRVLPIFRTGLGGRLGSGQQWLSWIAMEDLLAAMDLVVRTQSASGAINFTAPTPVTNAEFTATLAQVLKRPAILPVPATALRLVFGEMADAALLASQRVLPRRLKALGFNFGAPTAEVAIRQVLDLRRET